MLAIGVGTAQLALVVMLATALALFLGSGQMFASQAAVSAALVATLQPPTEGVTFDRFLDALVGRRRSRCSSTRCCCPPIR